MTRRGSSFCTPLAVLALTFACTPRSAPDETPPPEVSTSAVRDAAPAVRSADGDGSRAGACASDAECTTWSSYCQEAPCACRAIATGDPRPKCASPGPVNCFADPCASKAAACQEGRCVLVTKSRPQPSPSSSM